MMKIPSIFRYPGSKLKFLPVLIPYVEQQFFAAPQRFDEYVEPYFGGGAGMGVLQCLPRSTRVRINDLDPGVCALWQAVQRHPEQLKAAILKLRPTVKLFYDLKQRELKGSYTGNIVKDGLHKVVLNRLSVSGYGSKSGGPLGGRKQSNPSARGYVRFSEVWGFRFCAPTAALRRGSRAAICSSATPRPPCRCGRLWGAN